MNRDDVISALLADMPGATTAYRVYLDALAAYRACPGPGLGLLARRARETWLARTKEALRHA